MSRLPVRLRGAALMPVAALAVHQLRYLLAYRTHAGSKLAEQGHSYLTSLTPLIVMLCAVGLGGFLTRLARAWRDGADRGSARSGFLALWLTASLALIAIYAGQEFLEGLLASGHPAGLSGILGGGGWWAIPAAVAMGMAVALLLRGAHAVVGAVVRGRGRRPLSPRGALVKAPQPVPVALPRCAPLAGAAAGRAPPRIS